MQEYLDRIEALERELNALRVENTDLREQVAFLVNHPTIAAGIKGELLVATMLHRTRTSGNASYDIEGKVRIEVKHSRLTDNGTGTRRWTWGKVHGEGGNKQYDRLILIGEKDPAYRSSYFDPSSPYVLFDVPYAEVSQLITDGGTAGDQIRLASNPTMARSRAKVLYDRFQVTQESLKAMYGI